jgi:hypothetical protein
MEAQVYRTIKMDNTINGTIVLVDSIDVSFSSNKINVSVEEV